VGVYLFCYTFCMPRGAVEFFLAFVVMGIVWYDAYIGGMVGVGVHFGLADHALHGGAGAGGWSGVGSSGAKAKTAMIGVCSPDRSASLIPKIAVANVAPPRAFRVVPIPDLAATFALLETGRRE